jgi:signal transduction histidine kinase
MGRARRLVGRYGLDAIAASLAVAALVEDLINPIITIGLRRYDRGPEAVIIGMLCGAVVLVALRRRLGVGAPLAALGLGCVTAFAAPAWLLDSPFMFLLGMLLCGLSGFMVTGHGLLVGPVVVVAFASAASVRHPGASWASWSFVVVFTLIAWAVGLLIRRPVIQARTAQERVTRLEAERDATSRQAVIDERRRIARELHDVIAHSVSVMTVQAGAVRRLLHPDQDRERDALRSVERTGRDALAEMRRLVGLLRQEDEAPSYAPQPGLDALDALIKTVRDAGVPVELAAEGDPRELPPGIDLTAYRVVQEALTNALRHAAHATARVHLRWAADELRIQVSNDGRGGGGPDIDGHGQAGMQERVALYGGHLESGPVAGGGYMVRAYLPIGGGA